MVLHAGAWLTAPVEVYFPVLITGDKLIGYRKAGAERACGVACYLHVYRVISSPTWLELPNPVNWKLVSDVWIDCTVGKVCLTLQKSINCLGSKTSPSRLMSTRDPSWIAYYD
jgi:hypothetical protein